MGFTFNTFKKTFLLFVPRYLLKNSSAHHRWFFAILLIGIDVAVASLIPYYSKYIVDSLSINILNMIWFAIFFLGVCWILEKTVTHFQEIIFFPVINLTIRNLTYDVVQHIHHIALNDYKKLSIPEIINSIRRISYSARPFIKIVFLMIIPTILKLVVATIITTKAGLFGFILLPIFLLTIVILYKGAQWYTEARGSAWQASDKVTMRIHDSLLNTKIVRAFESFEMNQLGALLNQEAELWYKTNTRLNLIYILLGTVLGLTISGTLAFTILAIQQQTLTIGDFVLLKGQLIAAFLPLRTFSLEFRQLAESLVDIKKIIQIFDIPSINKSTTSLITPKIFKDGIFIKNLTFAHENQPKLFTNLSLHIPPGKKVAIIGESGSGKSTLINLIASFYKPTRGNIYIDGQEFNYPTADLQKKLYFIPQDFRLFNSTLRDNLTYGIPEVSENNLLTVVKAVGLLKMIEEAPYGFDTMAGEMGLKLSGGEKQKIALSRALLLKPEILLLDETTSSLSLETEKLILEILFSTIPTIILASHRTSTLTYMDQILKIKKGKLFEINISHSHNLSYTT